MLVTNYQNKNIELSVDQNIDAADLLALPALIDPHVHFRTPGHEYKEDWKTAAQAAIAGGVTTVMDMPNNSPIIDSKKELDNKKKIIDEQLASVGIPLHYQLYFGTTPHNSDEYEKIKNDVVGLKIYMESSTNTGDLLVGKKEDQATIFKIAAQLGLLVAVHAEDSEIIRQNSARLGFAGTAQDASLHSKIRSPQAAIKMTAQAIELAKEYGTRLYICHLSTAGEVELVKQAKADGLPVFAEATPHHLFLTVKNYAEWGTKIQMNPPLRSQADQDALWQGINEGVIDTIGTDHAPHTLEEKNQPYGQAPSGVPNIETYLPLLLDAHNQGRIALEKIVALTRTNIERIFNLPTNTDTVLVDLNLEKTIEDKNLKTKCGWSPFSGRRLKGWPVYTILNNKVYKI